MSVLSILPYFPFRRLKIIKQIVEKTANKAVIYAIPDKRFRPVCHLCGQQISSVHSWTQRSVRDLNLASTRVWIRCEYRKLFVPIASVSVSRNWNFFTRICESPDVWQLISMTTASR